MRRALSTRIRRIASAAAAKKWPRLFQCWSGVLDRPGEDRPRGPRPWLESLAGLLLAEPLGGEFAQLIVDERQQLAGCLRIALFDGRQDLCDRAHGRHDTARRSRPQRKSWSRRGDSGGGTQPADVQLRRLMRMPPEAVRIVRISSNGGGSGIADGNSLAEPVAPEPAPLEVKVLAK